MGLLHVHLSYLDTVTRILTENWINKNNLVIPGYKGKS